MSDDLLERARSGDRDAFTALVEPHRGELQLHCYRMLGSVQDAEDTLQEVLLSAWMGLEGFEGRSSVRTWLHRIATNRCLNALRAADRRPVTAEPPASAHPAPSRLGEVLWLQPYPDFLLDGLPDRAPGPEARYESREAVALAFITALQLLPPSQRAVLILRDVLGYRAAETAELLGITESAVTSALKRARGTMEATHSDHRSAPAPAPAPGSPEEQALTDRLVAAFTGDDISRLIALMTDDAWVRMPPLPFEYHGTEAITRFFTGPDTPCCPVCLMLPTRANGQPAWGLYVRDPTTGLRHCSGILVASYRLDGISALTHFETTLAPYFGLPRTAPGIDPT